MKKKITLKEYREINNIARRAAWEDINKLLNNGWLIKKSSGAHTCYILRPNSKGNSKGNSKKLEKNQD